MMMKLYLPAIFRFAKQNGNICKWPRILQKYLLVTFFMLVSPGVSGQINENFSISTGTGGNDARWSGSIASEVFPSLVGWTQTNGYGADSCIRLGTSSKQGILTTPSVGISGTLELTFRAGAWAGDSENLNLSISTGTLSVSSVTMLDSDFKLFTIEITGAATTSKISFTGNSSSRFFVDDVFITAVPTCTPPENPKGVISATTPACTSAVLSYNGSDIANTYWQTTATGKSIAEPASSSKTVTTSGTYYVRVYDGVSCWSTGTVSSSVLVNAPIIISAQPANATVIAGNNASFTVSVSGVVGYQWQVDSGSGFSSLSNVAPYSNVTSSTLNITNIVFGMNSYKYRCLLTANTPCSNTNTNGEALLNVKNASPNNALNLVSCIANNQITLKWDAAFGTAPTGYIVFSQPNSTIPRVDANIAGNAAGYIANGDYNAATTYSTLGKVVFKGNALTATITGLTNLSQYTFKVVAYRGETGTGWATAINDNNASSSFTKTNVIDVPEISNLVAGVSPTTSTVSWNVVINSAGCYEYMVVANSGAVALIPTGNGSAYSASTVYAGVNSVVYKGTGNSVVVTGLTEGVNYCYKVFVREIVSGIQWSDGVSGCQTTGVSYCLNNSTNSSDNGITNVTFNTINNSSIATPSYTDFSGTSTSLLLGENYSLSVKVKTYAATTSFVKAWIDWNKNGNFESGEAYDLGTAKNANNDLTSSSPIMVLVPTGASLGNVRMRIISAQDNVPTACTAFPFGEVEDYTINIMQPVNAEINVRGGASSISIPNGFESPNGLNNTQFAVTGLGSETMDKEYFIENIGIANLNLTGSPVIKIEGANPLDFVVTQQATSPVINNGVTFFKIKFRPTVSGLRTASVRIENDDSNENPYIFAIEGTGNCAATPIITVFPTSGPKNTLVTFSSSTSNLLGATVTYNNINVPISYHTAETIEVFIPIDANDGNFIIQLVTGCTKTLAFDVINVSLSSCETSVTGGASSDLFIYEVYDENGGSGGVVTIYNNTGASVNLGGYSIQRAGTYGGSYSTYANLSGTIAAGAVAIIGVSSSACGYTSTGNGSFGATGFNDNDGFRLMKGAILIDDVHAPSYAGYYLKRKNTNLNPNTVFDVAGWVTQAISSGQCLSGVGTVPIIKTPPTINTSPQYAVNCGITGATLNVEGAEGVAGGLTIAYQWYVLGTSGSWIALTNDAVYSGVTTKTLTISDLTGLDNYQYYCQIRENSETCYTATNSTQIRIAEKTWNGSNWIGRNNMSTTAPTIIDKINLNGNYNTFTNGNLNGCSLKSNSPYQLTISGDTYANVEGNIANNGDIVIESDGNLLQKNDAAAFTGTPVVAKRDIVVSAGRQQYNYMISPLVGQILKTIYSPNPEVLYHSESNNRFYNSTGAYIEGRGLAVKEPANGGATTATFVGPPKNGIIAFPIVKGNVGDPKRGYNLVGNPYPSNIDLVQLFALNGGVGGNLDSTVYFWDNKANSQTEQAGSNYGGQAYATFNMESLGQTAATGDPSLAGTKAPTRFVKTAQGFMVKSKATTAHLLFNNSIRTTQNGSVKFFGKRADSLEEIRDKFWLNMITPTNLASNINIVYFDGGNNSFSHDDSPSMGGSDAIYSLVENEKIGINGRSVFLMTDIIPLGSQHFVTGNYRIELAGKEGVFANGQNIYLKDKVTLTLTNLSEGNYTFQATAGEVTGRFEIIYKPEVILVTDNKSKERIVIYRDSSDFVVQSPKIISEIEVYDLSGKLLIILKPNSKQTILDALRIPNGIYVLKITTADGEVTNKKISR